METTNRLQSFALAAAPHAAAVANYCDHVEHNENVAMKFTIELDIRALLPLRRRLCRLRRSREERLS